MVKIPKRSSPAYLTAHDVEDGDLATILEPPYILQADKSRFGKERTIVTVQVKRTGEVFRWGLNNTSNDRLVDKYGEDGELWKDKQVKIQKRNENIRGQDKCVMYALPSIQAKIAESA